MERAAVVALAIQSSLGVAMLIVSAVGFYDLLSGCILAGGAGASRSRRPLLVRIGVER